MSAAAMPAIDQRQIAVASPVTTSASASNLESANRQASHPT